MKRAITFGGIAASLSRPFQTWAVQWNQGSATLGEALFETAQGAMAKRSTGDSPRIDKPDARARAADSASGESSATVVGVRISHPDRLIYPDLGTSKIQLARYYEGI